MARIGVFDLCSFFWTVAGTRKRGEDPYGLALQVLRYVRACAEKIGVEDVIFGADGPSGRSFRRSVCPDYKAGREAKDPEHRAELDALTKALLDAGFTVHKAEASSGSSATGGEPEWFEGDDVVASFTTTILKDPSAEVLIGSNDWDLAPLLAFPKVRLFTTRGEERTAADVKKEFGVEPLMLPQLKALAGDSDGYKPFPGLEKGKPGIGDKTAAAILEKFGSAEAAVRAAVDAADPARIVDFEGLPSRTCARLRTDAPVPSEIGFGEWAEVEAALLGRQKAQQSEPRPEPVAPPADAAKAFREAAHEQLVKEATEKFERGQAAVAAEVEALAAAGQVLSRADLAGVPESDAPFAEFARGLAEEVKLGNEVKRAFAEGRIGEFAGEGAVPDLIGRQRDPKGLGVSGIVPAVTPLDFAKAAVEAFDGPIDKPVAPEKTYPLANGGVGRDSDPCPDGKCPHPRGEHAGITGENGCAVVGCPCMHEDNPNFRGAEAAPAPRKRRSRAAATVEEPVRAVGDRHPDGFYFDAGGGALKAPAVLVLLTEAEFVALTPLPALFAAGLLTPPESYAGDFAALLAALRDGAFRPCDGVFIGSVPEACRHGVDVLAQSATNVLNGVEVAPMWRPFYDQLHLLPRFTDLAKYGGKLVRA